MSKQPQPSKSAVVTEEEAMLKNCPNELTVSCIGSRCMAWRWWSLHDRGQPAKGLCGLAGIPAAT